MKPAGSLYQNQNYCCVTEWRSIVTLVTVVISIPPSIAVSEVVRRIKGSSSHFANRIKRDGIQPGDRESTFAWQREYGVFSLGGQQLVGKASLKENRAIAHVINQKEHHARGSIERFLEPDIIRSS
ncbi:transposase [Chamaesiphon sp. VAR_48_metabat_135_sub]|uniref:transposase n=1 Tax=Chamaesiphon sp. VAR_48_metabat_135_sub TaxID=2964699 RepID=UPI00286B6D41|nr:transposase [Chamaesiphon sp. VAR_48_metabat_135_sub]